MVGLVHRKPKVSNLVLSLFDEDILGLEVPVDYPLFMHVPAPFNELLHHFEGLHF